MDKKRRFDFESSVRIPALDEIVKAASDFSETESKRTTINLKEAIHQNAQVAPKIDGNLSEIRKSMQKLARDVAKEEKKSQIDSDASAEEEVAQENPDGKDPIAKSAVKAVVKDKKKQSERGNDSKRKPGSTKK